VAAGGPAKGGQGRTAPHFAVEPTTLSQFQLAVWISLAAAENAESVGRLRITTPMISTPAAMSL